MGERIKTIVIAAGSFIVVTLVLCLIASVMMKSDKLVTAAENKEDTATWQEAGLDESDTEGPAAVDVGAETMTTPTPLPTATPTPLPTPTEIPAAKGKIAIDAGHQKKADSSKEPIGPGAAESRYKVTSGATGVASGVPEYELTLDIAKRLEEKLTEAGYEVVMIRETDDVDIADSERAVAANNSGADAVIHIHANADERPEIAGIMAFVPSEDNRFSGRLHDECEAFAGAILTAMESELQAKNWGVIGNDNLSTMNYTAIPATHLEVGYLSNKDEDKRLQQDEYREKIVKAIAEGIAAYFENKD